MSISEKLKNLRDRRNWSQEYAAQILNVDRSTLSKYETGKVVPPYQTLLRMEGIYKTEKNYLVGELDGSFPSKNGALIKENAEDHDLEMITELILSLSDLKKGLLEMAIFDEKKKAHAAKVFRLHIQALKDYK